MAQMVTNLPAMKETWVRSLGWKDPLEKEMATHSRILAWRIPWIKEPDGLSNPWGRKEPLTTEPLTSHTKEYKLSPNTLCPQHSASPSPALSWGPCVCLAQCPKFLFSSCMLWKLLCNLQNQDSETSPMKLSQLSLPLLNASHTWVLHQYLLLPLHLFCVPRT